MSDFGQDEGRAWEAYTELEKELERLKAERILTVIQKISTSSDRNGNSRHGWLVLRQVGEFPRTIFVNQPDPMKSFERMPDLVVSPNQFSKLKKGIF